MKRGGGGPRSQGWTTFIRNHLKVTAACDFFAVPTVAFRNLFVFVVLSHDRRLIRHVAVSSRPTAVWIAEQIALAFPASAIPQFLVRDREGTYGEVFRQQLRTMGIEDMRISLRQC